MILCEVDLTNLANINYARDGVDKNNHSSVARVWVIFVIATKIVLNCDLDQAIMRYIFCR